MNLINPRKLNIGLSATGSKRKIVTNVAREVGRVDRHKLNMPRAIQLFLDECAWRNLSKNTVCMYRDRLSRLVEYLHRMHDMDDAEHVTIEMLRGYISSERQRGLSSKTLNHAIQSVKTFFGFLKVEGLIDVDPSLRLRKMVEERKIIVPLRVEEVQSILDQFDPNTFTGARDRLLVLMLYDAGLRISEAVGIRLDDLYLEDGSIRIMGKGRRERYAFFSHQTKLELMRYLRRWFSHDLENPPTYLFPGRGSNPLTRTSAGRIIREAARAAGIDRVHPHLLRHSFALGYLNRGGDPITLQRELGHSGLEMVSHYVTMANRDITDKHSRFSPASELTLSRRKRKK